MAAQAAFTESLEQTRRAAMQDWTKFPLFLQASHWTLLQSADHRQLQKLEGVLEHLVSMGLRHPSERTMCTLASLVSHAGGCNLDNDPPKQIALLGTIKSVVKLQCTRAKIMGRPLLGGYLAELPNQISDLPDDLAFLFPNGQVEAPIDLNIVWQSANAWTCRSTHRAIAMNRQDRLLTCSRGPALEVAAIAQQAAVSTAQTMLSLVLQKPEPTTPFLHVLPAGHAVAEQRKAAQPPRLCELLNRAVAPSDRADVPPPACSLVDHAPLASNERTTPTMASKSACLEDAKPLEATDLPKSTEVLEETLTALATAHYQKDLPKVTTPQSIRAEVKKRPSGRCSAVGAKQPSLKRPASAATKLQSASLKRPASGMKHVKAQKKCGAKHANTEDFPMISRKEAKRKRPNGCSKCRQTVGCCRSCWRYRGFCLEG